ncbi:MAG: HAD-IA family hydrolase [Roseobacter sp.]
MKARIVFDLDGTLIDSAPDIQNIANTALAELGVAPISLQETHSFIGEGVDAFVRKMRAARDVSDTQHDKLLQGVVSRYDDAVTLTVMYPGVTEALALLSRNYAMGICTNKLHRPAMAVLKHLRIDHFFGTVWGGDNDLARKPDPAPLIAAFDALGEGTRIYVGDSEVDAETAKRAGVPFVFFTEGYRKLPIESIPHTARIDSFSNLAKAIERILRGQG